MGTNVKYRYTATGRSGSRVLSPVNENGLALQYAISDEKLDYDVTLSNKLKFIGDDFLWLYTLEKTIYRCDYISILIEKYCSGSWGSFFVGRLSLNSGDPWNLDQYFVELEILESVDYDCITDGGDTAQNIIVGVPTKIMINTISGTIQTQSFTLSSPNSDPVDEFPGTTLPYSKGWTIVYKKIQQIASDGSQSAGYSETVIWNREVMTVPVAEILDSSWVEISNDGTNHTYARTPIIYNLVLTPTDPLRPYDIEYSYSILAIPIDNGMSLQAVFQYFLNLICPQLVLESDFFQWNAAVPTNINYVTGLLSKVRNLIMFQKTDIKRPSSGSNATIGNINFNDLLKDICTIFQLKYSVTDDFKFKIEHVNYYKDRAISIDTTLADYMKLTRGNRAYNYDEDGVPLKETFAFMDISSGDFASNDIIYSGSCAGNGTTQSIDYVISNITTDVQYCLTNPSSSSVVNEDGFVLIACDDANTILREAAIHAGNVINNSLAWAQLHRDYWRYNRPLSTFMMNEVLTSALSVKPIKIQVDFSVPLCCTSFDPKMYVKSSIGNTGVVKSAKYDLYQELLTLTLVHNADEGLIDNDAPVTIGDTGETFENTPVTIDVLANDYDPDGFIVPSTLKILINPIHGTATITSDFKVLYTPTTDYIGSDFFIYNVQDNFKDPSPNCIVNITVKSGAAAIQANDDNYAIAENSNLVVPASNGLLANDIGPSALSAIAVTAATAAGGSVTIHTDGSFSYTPANNFIGADTFGYTATDINGNQSTAVAHINVFAPQSIYVALRKVGPTVPSSTYENCSGHTVLTGEHILSDYYLDFFSDSAKTVPINVSGYALSINVKYTYNLSGSISTVMRSISAAGTSEQIESQIETERKYYGCANNSNENDTLSLSLQTGTGYNI